MRFEIPAIGLVCWLIANSLWAGTIPGRWEKVVALEPGTEVEIELESGDMYRVQLTGVTGDSVEIVRSGRPGRYPKSGILRIWREGRSNRRVLIGLGIGAGAGAAAGALASQGFDETFLARTDLMALTFGAVGAAVGAALGYATRKPQRELLYQSP